MLSKKNTRPAQRSVAVGKSLDASRRLRESRMRDIRRSVDEELGPFTRSLRPFQSPFWYRSSLKLFDH